MQRDGDLIQIEIDNKQTTSCCCYLIEKSRRKLFNNVCDVSQTATGWLKIFVFVPVNLLVVADQCSQSK